MLTRSLSLCLAALSCTASALQVTGATGGVDPNTHARPFRNEINQFSQSGPAFDLYIQALQQYQSVSQSNMTSYFQIAGIHGWPIVDWDGVHGSNGRNYPGYCLHAAVPFPTWHRPYLALYEQLLSSFAQQIAQTYPSSQRTTYVNAATNLRIPYWDWAVNASLPSCTTVKTITINTPQGQQSVSNPLYQYNFQSNAKGNGFGSNPVSNLPNTVRHYNSNTGQSDNAAASAAMQSNAGNILSLVYNLFTQTTDYTTFSCTYPGGTNNRKNNVENIHNGIHNSIGGSPGHMSYPELAGFDPIFWLHHANVDRIFALWQVLNPNSYLTSTRNGYGSYYETAGTYDSGSSSLAPFHISTSGSAMYTNDGVRNTATFGYSYPEISDWNVTQSQLQTTVRQKINQLYNPSASKKTKKRGFPSLPGLSIGSVNLTNPLTNILSNPFVNIGIDLVKGLGINNLNMQWTIQLQCDRFAADSSFEIDFFMGSPSEDYTTWSTAPNLIGTHAQFINADVNAAHPDGRPQGTLQGEISLNAILAAALNKGSLSSLDIGVIIPILKSNLQWRARSAVDGTPIDIRSISGLSVTVVSQTCQPRTSLSEFPTYGPVISHPEITAGKSGY